MGGEVRRIGCYVLAEKIGSGSFGQLWLARKEGVLGFGQLVAVKKMTEHHVSKAGEKIPIPLALERFSLEAKVTSHFDHPNLVRATDLIRDDDGHYLVLDYIQGVTLRDLLQGRTPLDANDAAHVVAEMCDGLHFAHTLRTLQGRSLDIVHRDMKPENVMISGDGVVKVIDFGIAGGADEYRSHMTEVGAVLGSPSYLSPEQIDQSARVNGKLDARSDVFSLGAIFWELLVGRRRFPAQPEVTKTILQILKVRKLPPSGQHPGLTARFDEVVNRALQARPEDRYESAEEMRAHILQLLPRGHASADEGAPTARESLKGVVRRRCSAKLIEAQERVERVLQQSAPDGEASGELEVLVSNSQILFSAAYSSASVESVGSSKTTTSPQAKAATQKVDPVPLHQASTLIGRLEDGADSAWLKRGVVVLAGLLLLTWSGIAFRAWRAGEGSRPSSAARVITEADVEPEVITPQPAALVAPPIELITEPPKAPRPTEAPPAERKSLGRWVSLKIQLANGEGVVPKAVPCGLRFEINPPSLEGDKDLKLKRISQTECKASLTRRVKRAHKEVKVWVKLKDDEQPVYTKRVSLVGARRRTVTFKVQGI